MLEIEIHGVKRRRVRCATCATSSGQAPPELPPILEENPPRSEGRLVAVGALAPRLRIARRATRDLREPGEEG
jgi:hypothetical protein